MDLYKNLSNGEDSKNQFKRNITNPDQLAAEIVAFSNSSGGIIYIGVDDNGSISGLSMEDIRRLNGLISNVASQHVHPPINPSTRNFSSDDGKVLVLSIPEGISKPYTDNQGAIWVKSGADKRKVTAREEMQRMFQISNYIHADELPVNGLTVSDIDLSYFESFFANFYGEPLEEQQIPLPQLLQNMNLAKNRTLNLTGTLLFSRQARYRLPMFIIKAVHYPGHDIDTEQYIDNRDFSGLLEEIFDNTMSFIMGNIPYHQDGQNVNSLAKPIVEKTVWEELLANALLHRDYFISSPIRVFMFEDRVEIISPGSLPNSLTIENIKAGNSISRNPILATYGTKILPYRGLDTGIRRTLKLHSSIEFKNDVEGNQFVVTVYY